MNFLGIGPLELIFIIIIMILVLGPQQMVTTARKAGALIRKVVKSPMWGTIMDTSREIREIPTRLVREAGLEEDLREIRSSTQSIKDLKNISVTMDPLSIGNQKPTTEKPVTSVPTEINPPEQTNTIAPSSPETAQEVPATNENEPMAQPQQPEEVNLPDSDKSSPPETD